MMLDAEQFEFYRFAVIACDQGIPPLCSLAKIIVRVNDLNDLSPKFLIDNVSLSIDENTDYSNIFTFSASDGDRTSPNNQFYFSITASNPIHLSNISNYFVIDADTGVLATSNPIDREEFSEITLNIAATDTGNRSNTASITITINDENDIGPRFTNRSYQATIDESHATATEILIVSAEETNGDENTQITYSLDNAVGATGNPKQLIDVDSLTGVISASQSLDYETLNILMLSVTATDGTFSDTVPLIITLNNVNDNAPILAISSCNTTLPENTPLGEFCSFSVSDADQDGTTEFTLNSTGFTISPSTTLFEIIYGDGASTASLILRFLLDFEAAKTHPLTITLTDKVTPVFTTSISFTVTVTGVNEHAPSFANASSTFNMDESEEIDYLVGVVTATDMDDFSTPDGVFTYSIPNQDATFPFKIDSSTGVISLQAKVNFDDNPQFMFDIIATDSSVTNSKTGTTMVTIEVADSNENPPVFASTFSASINESIGSDVSVLQIFATDADNADVVTYSIASGDAGSFVINSSSGVIYTTSVPFDFETTQVYYLLLEASDNSVDPRIANTLATITILDINDNPPIFDRSPIASSIFEETANVFVMLVSATDLDSTTNGEISYTVNSTDFTMDATTGRLTTSTALDRETQASYTLMICAFDKGATPMSVCETAVVTLLDINDNDPVFDSIIIHSPTLAENLTNGEVIATFVVSDMDVDPVFFFTLDDDGGPFTISSTSNTATITLFDQSSNRPLDRELRDLYTLVITVNDGLSSITHTFTVMVTDVNDQIPLFEQDTYILPNELSEDSVDGFVFFTVLANDNDDNTVITYSLLDTADDRFSINSTTGEISVDKTTGSSIDFEMSSSHEITVQSSDGFFTSTATVLISIGDVNDNPPTFLETSYNIQVLETIPIGTTILAVQAIDLDSGTNALLSYEIASNNSAILSTFELARSTGILRTIATLDADSPPTQYTFNISASDSSSTPSDSLVSITISILGENEDIPVFSHLIYTGSVMEEVSTIASVLTVSATEVDTTTTISYSIPDFATTYFSINSSTGQLSLIAPLDREEFEIFTFTVLATDGDDPPGQGHASVQITIIDTNDNTPKFLLAVYSVTISETTPSNQIIITVEAADGDATMPFNKINYSFNPDSSLFSIDSMSGEVSVSGSLDFDSGSTTFTLLVVANDSSNTGVANLVIDITDENDNPPVINNTILAITLNESSPAGTEVIDIEVLDVDTVGVISFEITSGNANNVFNIDSSGRITLGASGLDFESITSFTLMVRVFDGLRSVTAVVTITVRDSNDNSPTFDLPNYSISLPENNMVDFSIIGFTVTDPDSGNDGAISLSIDSTSNIASMFKLTPDSGTSSNTVDGEVFSAISLDRETDGLVIDGTSGAALWTLKVLSADNNIEASIRLTTTAEIVISITDINDNSPQFSSNSITAQVSESSNVGTLVHTLTATDADFGTNADITFAFTTGSANTDKFSLDAITGELRTTVVLSREDATSLTVNVEASDGLNTDVASVTITVEDINDHNPEFDATSLTVSILENATNGTLVVSVGVMDEDDGLNGDITLSIIGGDINDHFRISSFDVVVALDEIDRESISTYELILLAQDSGTPIRQATATVTVTISDVNDNPPSFALPAYTGSISEDASSGFTVDLNTPISVVDIDQAENSMFTLSLDDNSIFDITTTRNIFLNPSVTLDRETVGSFSLLIIATDAGSPSLTSNVSLDITVQDVNDNPPIFSPASYAETVLENIIIGTSITTVVATDRDEGANMQISYSLFSGTEGKFEVNRTTGDIKLIGSLDRETTNSYEIVIAAFDSGATFMSTTATVTLTVEDFNDNTPEFSQTLYTRKVDENSPNDTDVVYLIATDLDIDENAILVFSYQDPTAGALLPFTINSTTGNITVSGSLDREMTDRYSFEVIVRDDASIVQDRLTATANVIIDINDLNDVVPSFPGVTSFTTDIQETTLITTIILFPVATDPDLGDGGDIIYSASPESTIFSVDPSTGVIRLTESLDLDSSGLNGQSQYTFDLLAADQGSPALTGTIAVIINVLDKNTNVPLFDSPPYTAGVLENATNGTFIIQLTASDADTNGVINYEIVGGNQDLLFEINATTGAVSTRASLLNSENTIFELTIRAFETGDLTKSSITSLHIEITDTNNNRPFFCQTVDYSFSISENSPVDTTVGQICGSDQDSGINGQFVFIIQGGNNDTFKIVQASGASVAYIVVNQMVLDRENNDEYSLVLIIGDNGIPQLFSDTIVAIIAIEDENDEIPFFTNLPFSIDIDEDVFGGFNVFLLLADDNDISSNGEFVFEIIDGNIDTVFSVESVTGQITTIRALDFNTVPLYTLEILVTDNGSPALSVSSTLTINITDVNNHAPVFMPPYEASVQEDSAINSFVILVEATDDDATTNAELVYTISDGVNADHFAIEATNGSISVNTTDLDREVQSSYNLMVTACDMGVGIMCATVGVTITITDANDHPPIFNPTSYSFVVSEDKNVLFIIGTVFANDLDEGQNGVVEYSLINSGPKFSISLDTGDVILGEKLDRETADSYQIMVRAVDKGDPVMTAIATINITVTDVNDNAPIIDTTIFSLQITETTAVNIVVFDVDATDIDLGDNSKITYAILGGHFDDFSINSDSGAITVNNPLDAEGIIRYDILIQASDSAFAPLTDTETLVITIIDINEHAPVFGQSEYLVDLPENSPSGTFLLNVTASDDDIADTKNSEIFFFLTSTDFVIDSETGKILTVTSFDREVSTSQSITVMAINPNTNTTPALEGSALISITITDLNDETPYFTNSITSQAISELSQIGDLVIVLTAEDNDDPNLENGRVVFSSASENTAEFDRSFRIDSDGIVGVNGPLDRETQENYSAIAVVTDNGDPSLSSIQNITIRLVDENDIPPNFSSELYSLSMAEDIDPISQNGVSRRLVTFTSSDGDKLSNYQLSEFEFAINSPFSSPDFEITSQGDLFLNIGLDRETRDNYTLYLEVINNEPGHILGSYCNPLNTNRARFVGIDCILFGSSIFQLTVTDINDNDPIFVNTPYYFAVLSSTSYDSDIDSILAIDADISDAGEVRYSLSVTDITIDNLSGTLRTAAIFTERAGEVISGTVTASDQEVATSRSTTEDVVISIIDNDYLLLIVVEDTVEKTLLCIDELVAKLIEITSFQILIFEVTEHVIGTEVSSTLTSVFFYAIQTIDGTPFLVQQADLLRMIDDSFSDLSNICEGKIQTVAPVTETVNPVLQPPNNRIQVILIIAFCAIILICGCLANILALYQRFIGKRSIKRSDDFVYGGMEGLDVLTTQRDMVLNQADIRPVPIPITEEINYESQELKMDLFLDEIPEDEFISGSEKTSSMGGSLLAAALDVSMDDDDNYFDDTSVSAI
ncbi:protocadherin Fat 4-like [Oopsacas minuta]|uniref:Protocadherin Fat 4-like n=1 Tax=Oopsacas minuta TaxID=111878 RepID=A0AAV7K7G7_9METZ|nr:protocadherin Fat 4-like [Oopsacas minuta]